MENFLEEIVEQLIDEARKTKSGVVSEFDRGRLFAYYEIISKLLNQAEAFDLAKLLPPELRDFNPEDLLDRQTSEPS